MSLSCEMAILREKKSLAPGLRDLSATHTSHKLIDTGCGGYYWFVHKEKQMPALIRLERESGAKLAIAGLLQERLGAEVPLLSKTGCLAQSLRGACAILAQKTCMILPGLVAA